MNTLRPIRLKKTWHGRHPGFVFSEMPAGAAQTLVARGFAEYVDEQVKSAPLNRMMKPTKSALKTKQLAN